MKSTAAPATTPHRKKGGFIGRVLSALVLGLLGSVLINIVDWNIRGYDVVMNKLSDSYENQMNSLTGHNQAMATNIIIGFNAVSSTLNKTVLFSENKLTQLLPGTKKIQPQHALWFQSVVVTIYKTITIIADTVKVMLVKMGSLLCSLWIFIFATLLGLFDGLVARYVRTVEGGRESTFIFHKFTDTFLKFPGLVLLSYLLMPSYISSEMVIMVLSVIFFVTCFTATSQLKKYL